MIKFGIKNRFTGDIQFTAEIDCSEDEKKSIKLGLAVESALNNQANLSEANLSEANLSKADLSEANLSWANLSKADLSEADLSKADLSEADLSEANLSWANLSWADLSEADLSEANLSWANLSWADLSEANLSWADLSEADLSEANLSWANLSWANLSWADLSEANLSKANLSEAPVIENIHQKVCDAVQGGKTLNMSKWHDTCGTKHCRAGWVVTLAGKEGRELENKIGTSAAACAIYLVSDPEIKTLPDFHCSDKEAMEDIIACAEREKEAKSHSKGEA